MSDGMFDPTEADRAFAARVPVLHDLFNGRTVEELIADLSFLIQFARYRQHVEQEQVLDVLKRMDERFRLALQNGQFFPDLADETVLADAKKVLGR